MGFLDKLKGALGGKKEAQADTTKGPSQVLRENGIDPSGLKFAFGGDGTVTIAGTLADAGDRDRIVEIVRGLDGVNAVVDHMSAPAPEPKPDVNLGPEATPEPAPESGTESSSDSSPEETPDLAPGADEPPPSPAGESDQSGDQNTYTVQPGDSLWKIAEAHYGSGGKYMKIFEANRDILDDPNKIYPGQELVIPADSD